MGGFGGGGLGSDDPGGLAGATLGEIFAGIEAAFTAAVGAILNLFSQFVKFFIAALRVLVNIFGKVGNFFKFAWENGISKLLKGAFNLIQKAHQFLEAKLAPVIKFLKRVRSIVDRYYKLYLKPYLNLIQKMRRYLAILKLLHIKWAQQLDARLARTEQQITRIFLDVRGSLNMVLNTVEAMTDPRKLSRWVLASVAGRRVAAATVRAFTGLPLGHFAPSNAVDRFAWEHPPLKLADYSNPRFNPPPSVIMAGLFTAPTLDGTIDPDPPDDATLDAAQPLDYFDDILHSMFVTDVYFADPSTDEMSIVQTVEQQDGLYIDAAGLLATMVGSTSA